MKPYLWMALRRGSDDSVEVVGFKEAEYNSVLAGQTLTCYVDSFKSEEEARSAYPECEEGWTSKWTGPQVSVFHLSGYGDDDYDKDDY